MMNPEEGCIKEMSPETLKEMGIASKSFEDRVREFEKRGFTSMFTIGEEFEIKGCKFKVNNFVEEHGFMNLKIIPKKLG